MAGPHKQPMPPDRPATQVADLAWAGRHEQALAQATAALAAPRLSVLRQLELLDLRAESYVARGEFNRAAADAARMRALAQANRQPELEVQALNRQALVLMRQSETQPALAAATAAAAKAQAIRNAPLQARALLRLGEAQVRSLQPAAAVASGERAASLFEAVGDGVGLGRAHWVIAFAQSRLLNDEASSCAAQRAADLARQNGDDEGLGNALNVLAFSCKDIAGRIALLHQATQAFERSGYAFGRALVKGSFSLAFAELGLYRRACRLGDEVVALCGRMGARLNQVLELSGILSWQLALGDLRGVRAAWPQFDALVAELDEPITRSVHVLLASTLAMAEGDAAAAVKGLRAALRPGRATNPGHRLRALVPLTKALLMHGDAAAALRASTQATQLHRAQGFARVDMGQSQDIWWWHARALAANGRDEEAWAALQRAHAILLEAVHNVHDDGLRRSTLNKVQVNRDIVRAWLHESARRGLPDTLRLAHLAIASSLREPF